MKIIKDLYFLIPSQALETAERQQVVVENAMPRLQYCYYDGKIIDSGLMNLINVPSSSFMYFFSFNKLPIPQEIVHSNGRRQKVSEAYSDILKDISNNRKTQHNSHHADTFFLDRLMALNCAKQCNRVKLNHPTIDGLQICYYTGEAFDYPIDNLINIKQEDIVTTFLHTHKRIARIIVVPDTFPEDLKNKAVTQIQDKIHATLDARQELVFRLKKKCQLLQPKICRPYRIFFPTSRMTLVMQYTSKGLANAFKELGHDVHVCVEANEMEQLHSSIKLQEYYDFNPDIIVNVNYVNNEFLNEQVFNIIWWQDFMPELSEEKIAITHRKRDIVYSIHKSLDDPIRNKGFKTNYRQTICYDHTIFHQNYVNTRNRKVVFVGSSYINEFRPEEKVLIALEEYVTRLYNGLPITFDVALYLKRKIGVELNLIWPYLANYAIRDFIVEWLCQAPDIEVEVYGRYWDQNPIVKPHYRGEILHGVELAKVYNSALYCLSCSREEITNQRLAEIAACGSIPVVYDTRNIAEPPHWDDECLFFKTKDELYQKLNQAPNGNPTNIAKSLSYTNFATKILSQIDKILENESCEKELQIVE